MVDVLFRADAIKDADVPETTVTLLEGVEVLAVAPVTATRGNATQKKTTLAVTAEQANALKIAEGRGTFTLALRNPDDMQVAGVTQPQTLERLLNLSVKEEFTTRIYRRGSVDEMSFPGRSYVPQPVTHLPLAGLLHGRGTQQPASIEKVQGTSSSEPDARSIPERTEDVTPDNSEGAGIRPPVPEGVPARGTSLNTIAPRDEIARSNAFPSESKYSGMRPDDSRSRPLGHTN
jgi:hypothetical protein